MIKLRIFQAEDQTILRENLNISVKTVETFKTRSMEMLGLRSRVDIVRCAMDRGWLKPAAGG